MNSPLTEFLTPKQQLFCTEYLVDMNATRAALRAGYSSGTALNGQLMNMPKIKCYLQQQKQQRAERVQFTHDQVLRELGKIAFGNMGDYFADDGSIKPMHEVSDDAKAALWSVSVSDAGSGSGRVVGDNTNNGRKDGDTGVTKFRLFNKLSALDKIAKHIGFYNPEVKQAETVFTYLNPEQMTADDTFDDAKLQEEIRQRKMQEARIRNKAMAKARRDMLKMERERMAALATETGDNAQETNGFDLNAVPRGEDGNVLCDGAGIPYGPLPKVAKEPEAIVVVDTAAAIPLAPVKPLPKLYGRAISKEEAAEWARERRLRELYQAR